MSGHRGVPKPFLDETGFPLALRHIREEVEARGGTITGSELLWLVEHPDPNLPTIRVDIDGDGEVLLDAGDELVLDVFCDEAWDTSPGMPTWTRLEIVLLAFLEGGFERTVWRDENGRIKHWGIYLDGPFINEAGGSADMPDAGETGHTVRYPAWPPRRERGRE